MPRKPKRARIEPLDPPFTDVAEAALSRLGPPPLQLFRVLARWPAMAEGIAGWGDYYMSRQSALSRRHRELVIDRVAALCGADYEWGVHIAHLADRVGLTRRQIRSLAFGEPDDDCWGIGDGAILRAVDELHRSHDLLDDTWMSLVDVAGEEGAVEVVLIAGWYAAISSLVRALRLPMEPATDGIRAAWMDCSPDRSASR